MQGNSAFSSSDADVIQRPLDVHEQEERVGLQLRTEHDLPLEEFYEIVHTAEQIVANDYKRIALQFPDGMLPDSVPIYRKLMKILNPTSPSSLEAEKRLFVLADTSYGSCCVDEVAAQHVNADAVVHYGHACLSPTSRLPVIYVLGRRELDIPSATAAILSQCEKQPSRLTIRQEVCYAHSISALVDELQRSWPNVPISTRIPPSLQPPGRMEKSLVDESEQVVIWIGGESLALTNILMSNATNEVYRYDPTTEKCQLESWRTNRLLMRRYYAVQRAKDADVFGIVVGTLGVASYLPLISHLRDILRKARKKSYTLSVGKLNPAKLGNFAEIECFIMVACPENSVVDAKEFHRPIVTPFELEVALGIVPTWTGRYVLDFEHVMEEGKAQPLPEPVESDNEDPDRPHFSLITGQYRHAKRYGEAEKGKEAVAITGENALIKRNQDLGVTRIIDSAAGEFLQTRSWRGLEQRIGLDAPSVLEQGRDGIAMEYQQVDHKES